jgi:hypothetical protein
MFTTLKQFCENHDPLFTDTTVLPLNVGQTILVENEGRFYEGTTLGFYDQLNKMLVRLYGGIKVVTSYNVVYHTSGELVVD